MRQLFICLTFVVLMPLCWANDNPPDSRLKVRPIDAPADKSIQPAQPKADLEKVLSKLVEIFRKDDFLASLGYYLIAHIVSGERPEMAIRFCDRATKRNPDLVEAYCLRGINYVQLRQYEPAVRDLNKFIEMHQKQCRGSLAQCPHHKDLPPEFKKDLEIVNDLLILWAHTGRGVAYAKLGRHQAAIKDLNKAVRVDPKNAHTYNSLGEVYRLSGDYEAAIRSYRQAVELDPEHPAAYYNLGLTYYMHNRPYLALRAYLTGFLSDADALAALKTLSIIEILTGRF